MSTCSIKLRQEVFEADAWKITDWLEDHEVRKYLNEKQNVSLAIKQIMQRVNLPILTHLFNQNGSFFMISKEKEAIGFLKLVPKGNSAEIVVVIGEKDLWGKGLGSNAILEGLKHAFYERRMDEVIAKINMQNDRSIRVFKKVGFKHNRELAKEIQYSITKEEFLKLAA